MVLFHCHLPLVQLLSSCASAELLDGGCILSVLHSLIERLMIMNTSPNTWSLESSALMVLVGGYAETQYRASRSTLIEALVAAPLAGLHTYIERHDHGLNLARQKYFSPYGCKWAPLRNVRSQVDINYLSLLEDGRFTVYEIPKDPKPHSHSEYRPMILWLGFTWVCLAGLGLLLLFAPRTGVLPLGTWIGGLNIGVLVGWSVLVRVIEYFVVRGLIRHNWTQYTHDNNQPDGIIMLGRGGGSGLVITGGRRHIKDWTTGTLDYDKGHTFNIGNRHWHTFIRCGTAVVLCMVLVTISNGSTTDQTAFVLFNILGWVNVFVGLQMSSMKHMQELKEAVTWTKTDVKNRTEVHASIIRYFESRAEVDQPDQDWVEKSEMLPRTSVWTDWYARRAAWNGNPYGFYQQLEMKDRSPTALESGPRRAV